MLSSLLHSDATVTKSVMNDALNTTKRPVWNSSAPIPSIGFLLAVLLLIAGLIPAMAGSAQALTPYTGMGNSQFKGSEQLLNGESLRRGQYLLSPNGMFALLLQPDGNLVLYSGASGASGVAYSFATRNVEVLTMQPDGNLVMYGGGRAIWASNTAGWGPSILTVNNDGNVTTNVLAGRGTWSSGRPSGGDKLAQASALNADTLTRGGPTAGTWKYLRSADRRYFLLMQDDGNLVLYGPGYHVLWASGTNCFAGNARLEGGTGDLAVQGFRWQQSGYWTTDANGNQVYVDTSFTYPARCPVSTGADADRAVVQTNGDFVLWRGATATWSSHTIGRV